MILTRIKPQIENVNSHSRIFSQTTLYQGEKTQEINFQDKDPLRILFSQKNPQTNLIETGQLIYLKSISMLLPFSLS